MDFKLQLEVKDIVIAWLQEDIQISSVKPKRKAWWIQSKLTKFNTFASLEVMSLP